MQAGPGAGAFPAGAFGAGTYAGATAAAATAPHAGPGATQQSAAAPAPQDATAMAAPPPSPGQAPVGAPADPGAPAGAHTGAQAGATMTQTMPSPAGAPAHGGSGGPGAAEGPPSSGWTSPERPELSPEHVALLSWWADMIAKGQFPGPIPGDQAPQEPATPADTPKAERTGASSRSRLVGFGLVGVAVIGLAVAFGPTVVSAVTGDPDPVPVSELRMPTTVGDLVVVSSAGVDAQLEPLIGMGVRPEGVTVTAGYGTDAAGPVAMAATATTLPVTGDAAAQLTLWAEQSGATLSEPLPGTATTAGITCAAAAETAVAPAGSMCVWSGGGAGGRAFVVATEPQTALERTAQLRNSVIPGTA
jgi:hypothetical protein